MTITRGPHLTAALALLAHFGRFQNVLLPNGACADTEQSPAGWTVKRAELIRQLRLRLDGKGLPRQLDTSYCGPACFLTCLLEDRPDLYTAYAISMWERGEWNFATLDLSSSTKLRGSLAAARKREPGRELVSDLDWLTMAPLSASTRPFVGRLFGTPAPRDQAGSVSYPGVVKGWFTAAGASVRADTMGWGIGKSSTELTMHLLAHWPNNWIVLQIDSSLLKGGGAKADPTGTSTFHNRHWVVVNPRRQPLVRAGAGGRVVPMWDALKAVSAKDPHPDMASWQTSLHFASWGDENTPLYDQHLGYLAGRIYGGFAFSRIP